MFKIFMFGTSGADSIAANDFLFMDGTHFLFMDNSQFDFME